MDFANPRFVSHTTADAIAWREREAARALPPRTPEELSELTVAEPLRDTDIEVLVPDEPEPLFTTGVKIAAASVGAALVTVSLAILQLA